MTHRIIPAIMSGGAGTRLWPASTEAHPKQFHALAGAETLIQQTLLRVRGDVGGLSFAPPIVLGSAKHAGLIRDQLAAIECAPAAIVLEPLARNTAAIAAVAATLAQEIDAEALVLLAPADHVIRDAAAFHAAIARAAPIAQSRIVTFGIAPNRPETGYGYIKRGAELAPGVFEVATFREKPDATTAQTYLDEGGYSWNAGIFLFSPAVLLAEFARAPEIRDAALESLSTAQRDGVEIALNEAAFARAPSQPLDIAIMEKTDRAAVAPCDIGWADIGAWDEIWRVSARDAAGNAMHGRIIAHETRNTLLHSTGPKICVAGVENLVVIATPEAVLIVPRERAQDVKLLRELALKS